MGESNTGGMWLLHCITVGGILLESQMEGGDLLLHFEAITQEMKDDLIP